MVQCCAHVRRGGRARTGSYGAALASRLTGTRYEFERRGQIPSFAERIRVSVEHRPSAGLALIQHRRAQYPRAAFRFAFEAHHVPLDHDEANDVTADDRVYDLKLRSSV